MIRYLLIPKFCAETGYTEKAVRRKIEDGVWVEGSKTHTERDVDLMPGALKSLEVIAPFTKLKAQDIFESPITGRPWHDERSQRDTFWKPTLKRLGIRARRAYATRHTYATVALMGGVNPAYVAHQMGHASTKMFFETYSRWIEGADKGVQRAAMAALHSPSNFPDQPPAAAKGLKIQEKAGRRDWTRTNSRGNSG